ncbi:hypothetical protein Hdeb2414_s0001g00019971 [Helianthus debilis subsp. tardiflorus]
MEIVEDLVADDAAHDFDSDYEFDASHFCDFLKEETIAEAQKAESWFRFAHEYPPSPFLVKLKFMKAAKTDPNKTSSSKLEANKNTTTSIISDGDIDHKAASREMKINGVKHHNHIPQDNKKAKPKSTVNLSKPIGSSFMKPTASHLAKQNKECDIHSGGFGRLQKPLVSAVEKLRSPIRIQNQTTKRQKLEIGYLRKAAQLKHRASFLHKTSKKAVQLESSSNSKVKPTIPKKPALVTEERAQTRMSQNKSESLHGPPNRKILDAPKFAQHQKNMTRSNDKVHPIKDGGFKLNSKQNSHLPPTELFKKLSLKSEPETKVTSSLKQTHLTKENVPDYQQEFRRCVGKPNHYGTDSRFTEVKI